MKNIQKLRYIDLIYMWMVYQSVICKHRILMIMLVMHSADVHKLLVGDVGFKLKEPCHFVQSFPFSLCKFCSVSFFSRVDHVEFKNVTRVWNTLKHQRQANQIQLIRWVAVVLLFPFIQIILLRFLFLIIVLIFVSVLLHFVSHLRRRRVPK